MNRSIAILAGLRAVVTLGLLLLGGGQVRAIDPLPPELQNAPLEKKAEWWQRYSRDGAELRQKVAQQRWEVGQAQRRDILAAMSSRAEEVRARSTGAPIGAHEVGDLPQPTEPGPAESTLSYLLIFGGVIGGVFVMHRLMRETPDGA